MSHLISRESDQLAPLDGVWQGSKTAGAAGNICDDFWKTHFAINK
jgi:hypothetical protein